MSSDRREVLWPPRETEQTDQSSGASSHLPASSAGPTAAVEADKGTPLFRIEVFNERQSQWMGTVLLAPTVSHRLFALFALVATAAVLMLLFLGEFTRTARISGWLVPQDGLMRVIAPRAGVVTRLHVKEGTAVRRDEPLITLSAEVQSVSLGATQAEVARRLEERRRSIEVQKRQHALLVAQQTRSLSERLDALIAEEAQLDREIKLQGSRVALADRAEDRNRELRASGFISEQRLQQSEAGTLEQQSRLQALERHRITIQRERLKLEGELRELPLKSQAELAAMERSVAGVLQELAETEARRELVVLAPQDGVVTAIQVEAGGPATVNVPLLSIVPAGSKLEAHLYSPSRAVGFVHAGQRVFLRYQAYPYQKFGHYEGTVASVSRSAVSPGELPPQLVGLAGANGEKEPVYRITVELASQSVTAYGQQVSLQPGMRLEADIAIEKRPLIEWVLDPLYTLTGRWQG